ncbi:MAG TPA: glycosyltransferase [Sphingomicrobium sp.]|jgi:glycosyltransferase involved in cell wall biosynthesis/SAM-dependent methyltransferase
MGESDRDAQADALVSIVIPTFNYAHFLREALESAREQSQVLEVIVVDDGSSDNPAGVLGDFPGVTLIRQENRGLPGARNAGLQAAQAPYVLFLDADDRLLPGAIAELVATFLANPDCAFVHGSYRTVDSAWTPIWYPERLTLGDDAFAVLLAKGNLIGVPAAVLYRTDRLRSVGGFDEGLVANEDYDLYLRLLQRYRAASTTRVVAEYRTHSDNMSGNSRLMLSTGAEVVRRQKQAASTTPELRAAFDEGMAGIQRYWIRSQLRDLRRSLRKPDVRGRALRQTVRLAGRTPLLFLRESGAVAAHVARARLSTKVKWGSLRRTTPFGRDFGYARGTPIDRFYIERFLSTHAEDVQGHVLEIKDPSYTRRFGGDRVSRSDVLDIDPGNQQATIVADLNAASALVDETFDCILLTQTLQLIYDFHAALRDLARSLKPGGVLLLTVPWITLIAHRELGETWYWSFSQAAMKRLIEQHLPGAQVTIEAHGNVLAANAFLQGLGAEELTEAELRVRDPDYQLIVTVRAVKASATA